MYTDFYLKLLKYFFNIPNAIGKHTWIFQFWSIIICTEIYTSYFYKWRQFDRPQQFQNVHLSSNLTLLYLPMLRINDYVFWHDALQIYNSILSLTISVLNPISLSIVERWLKLRSFSYNVDTWYMWNNPTKTPAKGKLK